MRLPLNRSELSKRFTIAILQPGRVQTRCGARAPGRGLHIYAFPSSPEWPAALYTCARSDDLERADDRHSLPHSSGVRRRPRIAWKFPAPWPKWPIADGVTHVIATPHAHPQHAFDPELISQRRDELQAHFEGRLMLATGCDFHLSFENSAGHPPRSHAIHSEPEELPAGRVCRLFDSAVARPVAADLQLAGTSADHHASRNEIRLIRVATRASVPLAAPGMLRAGDRTIAAGKIRAVGARSGESDGSKPGRCISWRATRTT